MRNSSIIKVTVASLILLIQSQLKVDLSLSNATPRRKFVIPEPFHDEEHVASAALLNQNYPPKPPTEAWREYYNRQTMKQQQHQRDDLPRIQPRAFDPWPVHEVPLPCFPPKDLSRVSNTTVNFDPRRTPRRGLFFLKTIKTASSTAAGVHIRIAKNIARRRRRSRQNLGNNTLEQQQRHQQAVPNDGNHDNNSNITKNDEEEEEDFPICNAAWTHGFPSWENHGYRSFANRTVGQSFLWTLVRDPTTRAVSEYFHFVVSRGGNRPTQKKPTWADRLSLEKFRAYTLHPETNKTNYYVRTLSLKQYHPQIDRDPVPFANAILQDYDFIGTTERLDESLVALSMILNIPLGDVLYLSAKLHGGYDALCNYIEPPILTEEFYQFFTSAEWADFIRYDEAFHRAASQSLDLTIDQKLGRAAFEEKLALFRRALEAARSICLPQTVFPCSANGTRQRNPDCFWKDSGCGYACLDQVAKTFGIHDA